ncbi:MAG: acyl carrier protein [Terracidiphilus sp.]|jgi:acyl carrier protein
MPPFTVQKQIRFWANDGLMLHFARAARGGFSLLDEAQIYARLAEVFEDVFGDDSIKVTPELSARDLEGWDSLAHIRLILTIEKAFKIKFLTSEIGSLGNVGDLVKLIKARA